MDENKKLKCLLDSALGQRSKVDFWATKRREKAVTLLSRGKKISHFFTESSGRYISPYERYLLQKGVSLNRFPGQFDGLSSKIVQNYMKYRPTKKKDRLVQLYLQKIALAKEDLGDIRFQALAFWRKLSLAQVWNLSMIGAILFGMISMSFFYRYLGPGASADVEDTIPEMMVNQEEIYPQTKVLGAEEEQEKIAAGIYFESALNNMIEVKKDESESKIREMVAGYPIEEMVPYIAEKDPIVVAFLVSIARKESLWGRRVPVLNGQDCYNYWGYRGIRKLMGTGGHTCFNSRKDAVDTVAKRIEFLVSNKKLDTPAKMIIWKCGSNCAVTGGQAAANKWIADVEYYFEQFEDV